MLSYKVANILLDFQLKADEYPSEQWIVANIVGPITSQTKIQFKKVFISTGPNDLPRNICLESEDSSQEVYLTVRIFRQSCRQIPISVTLELSGELMQQWEDDISDILKEDIEANIQRCESTAYSVVKRCTTPPSPYLRSSDNRMFEYNIQETLFRKKSDFQLVEIIDTLDFGRVLILDTFVNLAESDTKAYTHTLMNLPHEDYDNKEVLILGGGDGGIIQELFSLAKKPKFVTMVDIDEVVMEACHQFMPSVCGNFLDKANREGPNHKIITGCAIEFMKKALSEGKRYDYIFGDLTDVPVSTSERSKSLWDFMGNILNLGVQLLKVDSGKYLTHCNGKNAVTSRTAFEKVLKGLNDGKCTFERAENFVPSFMETWLFYRIQRHN